MAIKNKKSENKVDTIISGPEFHELVRSGKTVRVQDVRNGGPTLVGEKVEGTMILGASSSIWGGGKIWDAAQAPFERIFKIISIRESTFRLVYRDGKKVLRHNRLFESKDALEKFVEDNKFILVKAEKYGTIDCD